MANREAFPTVSLMLPIQWEGPGQTGIHIRLKNLCAQAEEKLEAGGVSSSVVRARFDFLQETASKQVWLHQNEGLAVFISPTSFEMIRTPYPLAERIVIDDRPFIRALLQMTHNENFYIIVVDKHGPRFIRADRYRAVELDIPELPKGIEEVVKLHSPQKQLQAHSAGHYGSAGAAILHGSRNSQDERKDHIRQFCLAIERAVRPAWILNQAPIVLAGDNYETQIFREVTNLPLWHGAPEGSMKMASADQIRAAAWPLIEPEFNVERVRAQLLFRQLHGTGKATTDLAEILREAPAGRVGSLFIRDDATVWGSAQETWPPNEGEAPLNAETHELLNLAAVRCLETQSHVYECTPSEMPVEAPVAAVYRY